jgi:ACS family tartrate transporter-like MFS transporter
MISLTSEAAGATGRRALRKATWRLLPLLGLGYLVAYMDRINISFAALQMNRDLGFSATIYGVGGGLFFLTYALLELPSNMMLMRFGARRWIARIMLTWGVIAVGMMFVRTPHQFYVMRLLLGAAEAGFFPGVMFYLMHWFPDQERGRAISRFYVALPLSSVVMGVIAGWVLGLRGALGLAGWQWLFLIEGAPALLLSLVILRFLPDGPADAGWLTPDERDWILKRLARDRMGPDASIDHGLVAGLRDTRVWIFGAANVCVMGVAYAFNLSAPTILRDVTHWDAGGVGFLVAGVAVLGAVGMIVGGWYADRRGSRQARLIALLLTMGLGYGAMGLFLAPAIVLPAYAVTVVCSNAIQAVFWTLPGQSLHGRSAAAGVALIGAIGMIGAAAGPSAWGLARDLTGGFQLGLVMLAGFCGLAGGIILLARGGARVVAISAPVD